MNTFGEKLRQLRLGAGLTQDALAQKCGMAKQSISRYEKSDREPNIRTAKTIADALGVPLASLVPTKDLVEDVRKSPKGEQHDILLMLFDSLPEAPQEAVLVQLRALAQFQKDQGDR